MRNISFFALIIGCVVALSAHGQTQETGYQAEQERFSKVLKSSSDKERFIVLKYVIAHRYVPNREVDPFFDMYVMVGVWQRSLMVYGSLRNREDLLRKIYPDLEILDEYVHWGWHTGKPYKDTIVSKTILSTVGKERLQLDSIMGHLNADGISLKDKYFATPLLRGR